MMFSIALLLTALAADKAPPPAPLQPAGKWTVDYRADTCVASRTFGPKNAEIALAIEPPVVLGDSGNNTLFVVAANADDKKAARGTASITTAPDQPKLTGDYVSWSLAPGIRAWEIGQRDVPLNLEKAHSLQLVIGKRSFAFQTGALKPVLDALKTCTDNLMRSWGVDPAAKAKLIGNPSRWFSDGDYPPAARAAGASGKAVVVATVGQDGRVSACRVVASSKNGPLDETSCKLVRLRGRFEPEAGKNDRYSVFAIRWVLGG